MGRHTSCLAQLTVFYVTKIKMLGDKKVWTALYRGAWEKEVSLAGVSLARVCYVWMPTGALGKQKWKDQ